MNQDTFVDSIAKGIGRGMVLGGMTWQSGDDWIWQFRKVDDRIQIVRRNVRFMAAKGDPQAKAIDTAYTDSVLFSLPILTVSPGGASVVDVSPVFMSDLPQISAVLPGFAFSENKSAWAAVKGFPSSIELEVAPPTPRAACRISTRSPTAEAPRSMSITRLAPSRKPAINRVWPTIGSVTS
jgi:hypothetical protein